MSRNHLKKQRKDSQDFFTIFFQESSSSEGMGGYNTDLVNCSPSKEPSSFPHCSGMSKKYLYVPISPTHSSLNEKQVV